MTILVIAEHDNTSIKGATLSTLTAANLIDSDVHLLVAGHNISAAVDAATRINGITKVLQADSSALADCRAENITAQVLSLAKNYSHILFPSTSNGRNTAPRVAARLDVAQISDIIQVIDSDTFERPIYAGNAIATVKSRDNIKVITVRATAFDAATQNASPASIEIVTAITDTKMSVVVDQVTTKSDRPELTSAKIVVSGGRALDSKENFDSLIQPLADKLGAALGASRAAVDAGYAPNDSQVGQTGKIVAPELYIGIGISGAIQHLAGMKDSKIIVAINRDPDAPIFSVADYALEADLFAAIPELMEAL